MLPFQKNNKIKLEINEKKLTNMITKTTMVAMNYPLNLIAQIVLKI